MRRNERRSSNEAQLETEAQLKTIISAERLRRSQQPKLVDHVRALQSQFGERT